MKTKHFFLASLLVGLVGTAIQPSLGACVELLSGYLKDPHEVMVPGWTLSGTQFALVKITAVHTDKKPRKGWGETGTLDLIKIESNGKSLPVAFTIPYQKRGGMLVNGILMMPTDCETWDDIVPKTGKRLLGFFRHENDGWVIPELPSFDVVLDADKLSPASRKSIQPLFRARL